MKIFFLALFVLGVSTFAQQSSASYKFDEFVINPEPKYFYDEESSFDQRLNRFIAWLKREPTGKVYIVYYRARVSKWNPYSGSERKALQAKQEIINMPSSRFDADNVNVIDGGLKDDDILEFWIGRKNSSEPAVHPKYPLAEAVVCPEILINAQKNHLDDREPATFAAQLTPKTDIGFQWKVSGGKILTGQGTRSIDVDVKGVKKVVVTALSEAIPNVCSQERSALFEIGVRPLLFDEFERIPESDLRSRLDSFLVELSNNPSYTGVMVIYGRRSSPGSLDNVVRYIRMHFAFRNFPLSRVAIVKGGYREYGGMEIWLLPPGARPPTTQPTVDVRFVRKPSTRKRTQKRK